MKNNMELSAEENETYKEYIELVTKSQQILEELRKFSICRNCGKFYKGSQKNTKYCSSKCTRQKYVQNKFNKMTDEELVQHRLKERDRVRKYRNEIKTKQSN